MNPWRKPIAGLAFVLLSAVMIATLPLISLAAPQGVTGTPHFLPLVFKAGPPTATATVTSTATATQTATPTITSTPTTTGTPTLTPTATGTPITPTIPITVGVAGPAFSPKTITISAGDTVRWTWVSNNHSVTSGTFNTPDNQFCSPNNTSCASAPTSGNGATFEFTFTTPGTYTYFCKIHGGGGMTGTVTVNP